MGFYLGKRSLDDQILFESSGRPTRASTRGRFVSATGPFATRLGAEYYHRYGSLHSGPLICAEAERLAREDPNPAWQLIREQIELEMIMSPEELDEWYQAEAQEYEPDKPMIGALDVTDMFRQSMALENLYQEMI